MGSYPWAHIAKGGPESLIQLTLALIGALGLPNVCIIQDLAIAPFFSDEYPLITLVPSVSITALHVSIELI